MNLGHIPDRTLTTVQAELRIANISNRRIKFSLLAMDGISMLAENDAEFKIILSPNQSHKLVFEENCRKLHLSPSTIRIEYVKEDEDLEQFSKAKFLLPLVPAIKLNSAVTPVPQRVQSLWNKLTHSWQEVVSPKLTPDKEFFTDSKEISSLLTNMCEDPSEEINVDAPAEESGNNYLCLTGLFQLKENIAFLMKITFMNPIAMFVRFKYPESSLCAEDSAELNAVFTHLCFLLMDVKVENQAIFQR